VHKTHSGNIFHRTCHQPKGQLASYYHASKNRNCAIKSHDIPPKSVKGWTEHSWFAARIEPGAWTPRIAMPAIDGAGG
jgi:hypothetical protein